MTFAAGQMPDSLGVMVACHLEQGASCRQRAQFYERLGGELLLEPCSIEVSSLLLPSLLQRLDQPESDAPITVAFEGTDDTRVPRPLRRFLPGYFDRLPWTGLVPGIKEFELPISNQRYRAKFYKIAAGKELPEHTHRGNEFTLVLEGSFSDKAGDYHPSDFVLADESTIHQPKAAADRDCICFAVMDAPLKMTGFLGRLLNPFLR